MGAEKEKSIGSGSIENPFAASGIVIKHEEGTKTTEIEEGKWENKAKGHEAASHETPAKCCKNKNQSKRVVQDSVDAATPLGTGFDPGLPFWSACSRRCVWAA